LWPAFIDALPRPLVEPFALGPPHHHHIQVTGNSMYHKWETSPILDLLNLTTRQDACVHSNFHSQFQEDVLLLPSLLAIAGGAPGTFVELGAVDGIKYSNTLMMEKCFHWHGLLVEGNPDSFRLLQANQRARLRSARTKIRHSAVCGAAGGFVEFTVEGSEMAGVPSQMTDGYLRMVGGRNHANRTVSVPCEPLTGMMAAAGLIDAHVEPSVVTASSSSERRPVALLSLDVEGSEAIVLANAPVAAFDVALVEVDGFNAEKDARVHELLTAGGLRLQHGHPFDSLAINKVYMSRHAERRRAELEALAGGKKAVESWWLGSVDG